MNLVLSKSMVCDVVLTSYAKNGVPSHFFTTFRFFSFLIFNSSDGFTDLGMAAISASDSVD